MPEKENIVLKQNIEKKNPFLDVLVIPVIHCIGNATVDKNGIIKQDEYNIEYYDVVSLIQVPDVIELISNLKDRSQRLLFHIINILPVNQSYFDFNRKYYKRINNIESETTVTLAIGELMDNKIIAKSNMQNRFYINPKYIYNGSRIKQYPDKIDLGNRKPFYPKNK